MLFRASSEIEGQPADLDLVRAERIGGDQAARTSRGERSEEVHAQTGRASDAIGNEGGLPAAAELIELADAIVLQDGARTTTVRRRIVSEWGAAALVDAAAVAGNFMRMNRIADATGIPLDGPVNALSADIQSELGLSSFQSAANSKRPGWLAARLGPAIRGWASSLLGRSRTKRS